MKSTLLASTLLFAGVSTASFGAALSLDFQPTGGTTAAGYLPFEATNQSATLGASANYPVFGTTVSVVLTTANLPDGSPDFRSLARNGADSATNVANDWIGVDTRATGVDVTFTLTISGLPAGAYNWLSGHHDGGVPTVGTAANGNIDGTADYSFTDATGTNTLIDGIVFSRQLDNDPQSFFSYNFTGNGSPIIFTMVKDFNQGPATDANRIFAFMNSLVINQIPEPSAAVLGLFGLLGLLRRRR